MAILLTVDLPDDRVVHAAVLDAIAVKLAAAFTKAAGRIRGKVGKAAVTAVTACPEYESLVGGDLRGQLGATDADRVARAVAKNVADGVVVTSLGARRAGDNVEGGLRIEMLKGDYSEVLSVSGGEFTSEGGFTVPWLRWLTLEGDRILVADHRFVAGPNPRSRTGLGIMARPGAWRVPPQFSGTADDNWLTRALGGLEDDIALIAQEEIQKAL